MPPTENPNSISIGGRRFDPLDEQVNQQNNEEDEPEDPGKPSAWIVQFRLPLDTESLAELRARHQLTLTDFIPPTSYIEFLPERSIVALREDSRVRAVVRYLRQFKISPAAREGAMRGRDGDNNAPTGTAIFDAVLFANTDPADVATDMVARGAVAVNTLDDRAIGGALTLRFQLADVGRLNDIAELEAIRWVEPLPETVDDAPFGGRE